MNMAAASSTASERTVTWFDSTARLRHLGRSTLVFWYPVGSNPTPSRTVPVSPQVTCSNGRDPIGKSLPKCRFHDNTTRKELPIDHMTRIAHVLRRVQTRATPQHEKILGSDQVRNSVGGFAWKVTDWQRLDRFLVLGTEGGTFYRRATRELAQKLWGHYGCYGITGTRML
jgi:hypothetical protein